MLIDIPVGPTAKVRSNELAERLALQLTSTGAALGLTVRTMLTDGTQPVGVGIGPALEAHDLLAVLQNKPESSQELRQRALALAAVLLEMGEACEVGAGMALARQTLDSGLAWQKFQAICNAQGGMKVQPVAAHTQTLLATRQGVVAMLNNRGISRLASLAGAPNAPSAGISMHVRLGDVVDVGQPLMTLHAEALGELEYALDFYHAHPQILHIEEEVV